MFHRVKKEKKVLLPILSSHAYITKGGDNLSGAVIDVKDGEGKDAVASGTTIVEQGRALRSQGPQGQNGKEASCQGVGINTSLVSSVDILSREGTPQVLSGPAIQRPAEEQLLLQIYPKS